MVALAAGPDDVSQGPELRGPEQELDAEVGGETDRTGDDDLERRTEAII